MCLKNVQMHINICMYLSGGPVKPTLFKDAGFFAWLSRHYTTSAGANIRFDKTDRNEGNGYEPTTGIFKVPVGGLYNVYWHIIPYGGKACSFELMVNGKQKMRSLAKVAYNTPSGFVNLRLAKGDQVYLKASDSGTNLHSSRFNSFGAELVRY